MNKKWVLLPLMLIAGGIILLTSVSLYGDANSPEKDNLAKNEEIEGDDSPYDFSTLITGRTANNANSPAGAAGGETSSLEEKSQEPNQERVYCTQESRLIESCEPNDHPVCGWFDPQQVTCQSGPCVRSTFPNECEACITPTIEYWTESECPIHG